MDNLGREIELERRGAHVETQVPLGPSLFRHSTKVPPLQQRLHATQAGVVVVGAQPQPAARRQPVRSGERQQARCEWGSVRCELGSLRCEGRPVRCEWGRVRCEWTRVRRSHRKRTPLFKPAVDPYALRHQAEHRGGLGAAGVSPQAQIDSRGLDDRTRRQHQLDDRAAAATHTAAAHPASVAAAGTTAAAPAARLAPAAPVATAAARRNAGAATGMTDDARAIAAANVVVGFPIRCALIPMQLRLGRPQPEKRGDGLPSLEGGNAQRPAARRGQPGV
eukprot:scaffold9298_cov93-Isochrysis_galbana.AAC.3